MYRHLFLLFTCIGCFLDSTTGRKDYLYFASPGMASPFLESGLYGGPVRYQNGGNSTGVYKFGFTCAQLGSRNVQGFEIRDISYDQKTAEVLMLLGKYEGGKGMTLLTGSLCAGDHSCPNQDLEPIFLDVSLQYKMTAFAIYDSNIYFISEKIIQVSGEEKLKKIELRRLTHCNLGHRNITYPFTASSPFMVERCSTLISVIVHETFTGLSTHYTTSGLAVVPTKSNKLVFFVQLEQRSYSGHLPKGSANAMVLYRIRQGHSPSKVYEEYIGGSHTPYVIDGLGQITYRLGILCWTALDRIVCGHVDERGRLSNPVNVLYKSNVRSVCQAPPGEESRLISTIVTGVAIAKAPVNINKDEIVLYFGCYAQLRGIGGAGLLKKRGSAPAVIYPLINGTSRIYAGPMFMTKACSGPDGKHIKTARVISASDYPKACTSLLVMMLLALRQIATM